MHCAPVDLMRRCTHCTGVAMVRHPGGAQPAQIAQAVAQAAAAGHMGAMGPAAAVPAGQPRRQIRVRLLRINLRVALQLMVLAGILYQVRTLLYSMLHLLCLLQGPWVTEFRLLWCTAPFANSHMSIMCC